jgi:uncharacterized protein YegP (UPF0339 family)
MDDERGRSTVAKFLLYKNSEDKYYFRYKCNDGENVLTSEMFDTKESCMNGITDLQENAAATTVSDISNDKNTAS